MAESSSELQRHLPCPLCGRSLVPVPIGGSVSFHCKTGHELSLQELLTARSLALKGGLEHLLVEWRRQYDTLIHMVEDAQNKGYLDIAEIFHRHAVHLESKIGILQNAFSTSDSSKLMAVPDALRNRNSGG